jgi:hypothetical protein
VPSSSSPSSFYLTSSSVPSSVHPFSSLSSDLHSLSARRLLCHPVSTLPSQTQHHTASRPLGPSAPRLIALLTLTKSTTRRCCSGGGALTDESDLGAGMSLTPLAEVDPDAEEDEEKESRRPMVLVVGVVGERQVTQLK